MNKTLLVSGWLNYTHSICMVNLEHLKCFGDSGIKVFTNERAPLFANWIDSSKKNSLSGDKYYQRCLAGTTNAISFADYDGLIDIAVPPCLPSFQAKKKAVFMVSETDTLSDSYLHVSGGLDKLQYIHNNCDFLFTPSEWSRQSLINTGLTSNKILVIPHGVNQDQNITSIQKSAIKKNVRKRLGISENKIVILHIGAMTRNKGIDVLIKAIAYSRFSKDIVLLLKGNDLIFKSSKFVRHTIQFCKDQGISLPTIVYIGDNLSKASLNHLLLSCDVYASLFRSEGFNLPVAEAVNNQIPVLATNAPPVTEFMHKSQATYFVDANEILNPDTQNPSYFEPILDSCIEQINLFCDNFNNSIKPFHNTSLNSWEYNTNLLLSHLNLN